MTDLTPIIASKSGRAASGFCHACRTGGMTREDMDTSPHHAAHVASLVRWFGGPICATCADDYVETAQDGVMRQRDCEQDFMSGEWWPKEGWL